jgi:hypothetical protein
MVDDAFNFASRQPAAPVGGGYTPHAGDAPQRPAQLRQPIGLPRGSVRALMILMIIGTIVALWVMPPEKNVRVPVYLYYLMFLTTGAYFSGRGAAPPYKVSREAAPLGLPRGTIRVLLILAFIGGLGFAIYQATADGKFEEWLGRLVAYPANPFDPNMPKLPVPMPPDGEAAAGPSVLTRIDLLMPVIMIGAFFVGMMTQGTAKLILAGEEGLPGWYQDVQAWVSIVAMLFLGAEVILQIIVVPSMDQEKQADLLKWIPQWQTILSSIVAFYFGARS